MDQLENPPRGIPQNQDGNDDSDSRIAGELKGLGVQKTEGGGIGSVIQDILGGLGKGAKAAGKVALGVGKVGLAIASPANVNAFYDTKRKLATQRAANIAQDYFAQTGDDEPASIASHVKGTLQAQGQNPDDVDMNSVLDGVVKQSTQNQVYHFDKVRNETLKNDLFQKMVDDAFYNDTMNFANDSSHGSGAHSIKRTSDYSDTGFTAIAKAAQASGLVLEDAGLNKKGRPQFGIANKTEEGIKLFDQFIRDVSSGKFKKFDSNGVVHDIKLADAVKIFDTDSIQKQRNAIGEEKNRINAAKVSASNVRNKLFGDRNGLEADRIAELWARDVVSKNGEKVDKAEAANDIKTGILTSGLIPSNLKFKNNEDKVGYNNLLKRLDDAEIALAKEAALSSVDPMEYFHQDGSLKFASEMIGNSQYKINVYGLAAALNEIKVEISGKKVSGGGGGQKKTYKKGDKAVNSSGKVIIFDGKNWLEKGEVK